MTNLFDTLIFLTNSTAKMFLLPSVVHGKNGAKTLISSQSGSEIDAKKLASDWQRTGNDMRKAIVKYDRRLAR